jgi:hypothetical protein
MAMAVFKADEVQDEQLGWTILRFGGVRLYLRQEILTDELNWLKSNGYEIISFEASEWHSTSEWNQSSECMSRSRLNYHFRTTTGKI